MAPKRKRSRSPVGRSKRRGTSQRPDLCAVDECGRPFYAGGLCQTHHRQLRTKGMLEPIRRYRERSPDTVKYSGLRLTRRCVERLQAYADERGISQGAAIAEILEEWNGKRPKARDESEV